MQPFNYIHLHVIDMSLQTYLFSISTTTAISFTHHLHILKRVNNNHSSQTHFLVNEMHLHETLFLHIVRNVIAMSQDWYLHSFTRLF